MRRRSTRWITAAVFVVAELLIAPGARAQTAPRGEPAVDAPAAPAASRPLEAQTPTPVAAAVPAAGAPTTGVAVRTGTAASLTLAGYAEVFYSYNFNQPSNGVTNLRGFDNRHNTFSVSNVVLDAAWAVGPVSGRVALQVGHTPETYYTAEPSLPGGAGAGASNFNVWKFIQQANVAWRAPLGRGLLLEAGIFLSPIGIEFLAVKDNWNWSRSHLYFGLPFYHTGARATYPLTDELSVTAAVFNGWNSVVDNNPEKSVSASVAYARPDVLLAQLLYFGGVERNPGAPEGRAWRHLFDAIATVFPRPWLGLGVHADTGFEPGDRGTAWWAAAALYARVQPRPWLYLAVRGDFFYEGLGMAGAQSSSPIFWPVRWVSEGTVTADFRPHPHVSLRVEYRHDHAAGNAYYQGEVSLANPADPASFVLNAPSQDTVTAGVTAWF